MHIQIVESKVFGGRIIIELIQFYFEKWVGS